ncbi:MAG: VWA domain-containing protein [Candidatus Heimdallarchaeota archaeon]|nr:MAG: VWA domain-containing protein [Candidatus Heimdallarchaeota archaeon]
MGEIRAAKKKMTNDFYLISDSKDDLNDLLQEREFSSSERIIAEVEANTNKIELIGSVLLELQAETKQKVVEWATQLLINTTFEQIGGKWKKPKYQSERIKGNHYLDLDLDRTIENLVDNPFDKTNAIQVLNREHKGHSVLLIIDSSYSMSGRKLVMAAAAAATIAHLFDSTDIAIIHFGTKGSILKHFDSEESIQSIVERIFNLIPKGLTNIYQGLKVGIEELGQRKQSSYTAILLSDCDVNTGKIPSVIAWRLQGLKIITFPPVNDFIADILKNETKGELFHSPNVLDIPKILRQIFVEKFSQ